MQPVSANFGFLGTQGAQLVRLDSNTCLIKPRQFGKLLAQLTAAKADLLRRLKFEPLVHRDVGKWFHQIRTASATHAHAARLAEAINRNLRYGHPQQ